MNVFATFIAPAALLFWSAIATGNLNAPCRLFFDCGEGQRCRLSVAREYCDNPAAMRALADAPIPRVTSVSEGGGIFTFDASAVIRATPEALIQTSLCYDSYKDWQMPNVIQNRTLVPLRRDPVDNNLVERLLIWSHMRLNLGMSMNLELESKHFLNVRNHRGFHGISWNQVSFRDVHLPPGNDDIRRDETAFDWIQGSFFAYPLDSHQSYVRYFISSKVQLGSLTDFLPREFVSTLVETMTPGVIQVLQILADRADEPCSTQ